MSNFVKKQNDKDKLQSIIKNHYNSVANAVKYLATDQPSLAKNLQTSYIDVIEWLESYFNPSDEWLNDDEFAKNFNQWCSALEIGNPNSRRAAICQLKQLTGNNMAWAKRDILNATVFQARDLTKAIENTKRKQPAKNGTPPPKTPVKLSDKQIKAILDKYPDNIKKYEIEGDKVFVKGTIDDNLYAELKNRTRKLIVTNHDRF